MTRPSKSIRKACPDLSNYLLSISFTFIHSLLTSFFSLSLSRYRIDLVLLFCTQTYFLPTIKMVHISTLFSLLAASASLVAAAPAAMPAPTAAPDLAKRASCTFSGSSGASLASKSKASCATIVISSVVVPSGTTLDLTGLTSGTHVIFEGTTTFGYEEWSGPLISVSGTSITVTGASGNVIDGGGAKWWDGQGSNGGKTKPKFFYAHSLKSSSITGLNFKNSPVQLMSINSCTTLAVNNINVSIILAPFFFRLFTCPPFVFRPLTSPPLAWTNTHW
jgi:hypothetical protein